MIYQSSNYPNSFNNFLQLHSTSGENENSSSNIQNKDEIIKSDDTESHHNQLDLNDSASLEVVNDTIGKSFTIAAILGLKNNTVNHLSLKNRVNSDLSYNTEFSKISKLFQKLEGDRRSYLALGHHHHQQHQQHHHHHNHTVQQSSNNQQSPIDQCLYDNNTSNSSYQDHHHKQKDNDIDHQTLLHTNYMLPGNIINRSLDDQLNSQTQSNVALRNHILHHTNNTLLNKALNRESNRLDHFPSKSKSTSISIKNKRVRTIFTPEQLEKLEAAFEHQQYMVGPERLYLAHTLQLSEAQVKVWFQNRRIKWRKQNLELQQMTIARQQQQQQLPPAVGLQQHMIPSPNEAASSSDIMDASAIGGSSDIDE